MMKIKILKRILIVFIILLILVSNSVMAAIVSDADGAAFVTKKEFDTLTQSFAKQIDDYNSSISGKIDGAIAQYLFGIQISTVESKEDNIDFIHFPLKIYDYNVPLKGVYYPGAISTYQVPSVWTMDVRARSLFLRGPYADMTSILIPSTDKIGIWFLGDANTTTNKYQVKGMAMNIRVSANAFFMGDNLIVNDHETGILTFDQKVMDNQWGGGSLQQKVRPAASVYADFEFLHQSNKELVLVPDTVFCHNSVAAATYKGRFVAGNAANGLDYVAWTGAGLYMWGSPNHTTASFTDMNTSTHSESSVDYIDMIYNNSTDSRDTNNAPVAYVGPDSLGVDTPYIWYTNKKWNRIYDTTAANYKQASFENRSIKAAANYGIFGAITLGENIETEYEDATREWYKKSAIRQERLIYDFEAEGQSVVGHQMTKGIPILVLPANMKEIKNFKVTMNFDWSGASDKYIVFSNSPIDIQGTTTVPAGSGVFTIDKSGTTVINNTKAQLKKGENTFEFKGMKKGEVIYTKVLWNASDTDVMVTIKEKPTFEITLDD